MIGFKDYLDATLRLVTIHNTSHERACADMAEAHLKDIFSKLSENDVHMIRTIHKSIGK